MPPKKTANAMNTDLYLRGISPVVRRQFKAACRLQGRTMKEVAVALLAEYTRQAIVLARNSKPEAKFALAAKQVLIKGEVK